MSTTYEEVYCDYRKNKEYDEQGHICKTCDRCPVGFGKVAFKDRLFIIDPKHGALGCLHCVRCRKGTYSDSYSYGECQTCLKCEREGRYTEQECTSTQNTVCGGKILFSSTIGSSNSISTSPSTTSFGVIIGSCLGSIVLTVVIIATILMILRRRRKRLKKKGKRQADTSGVKNDDQVSEMTGFISSVETFSSSKTKDSGIEIDGECNYYTNAYEKDQCNYSCIDKIKSWEKTHDCSMVLSSKNAQMISKKIAGKKKFKKIGIYLGLSDSDIDVIETDNKDCEHQSYATLRKWKELKGSEATVGKFLEALLNFNLYSVAEHFCNKYFESKKIETRV